MNNYLNYYYNIYPDTIHEQNRNYYFDYENEKYYCMFFNRPVEDAKYLYELNQEMIRRGSLIHEIVLNKDKGALTFVNDIPYILMKVYVNEHKKSDLAEIVFISINNMNIRKNQTLDRSDWSTLWTAKVDYFEYQISQLGKKYPLLCDYLSYFIGMAENAISYVKYTSLEVKPTDVDALTLSHKRIRSNDTVFDLYNPISFVIDYPVRDFGEYIKAKFFDNVDVWPEIEEYFKNYDLSVFSKRMLYARLLFPSYFFDVYEDVIEGKLKEDDILPIVYKINEYEEFLKEIHTYINRGNSVPQLDWLNKKNSF